MKNDVQYFEKLLSEEYNNDLQVKLQEISKFHNKGHLESMNVLFKKLDTELTTAIDYLIVQANSCESKKQFNAADEIDNAIEKLNEKKQQLQQYSLGN